MQTPAARATLIGLIAIILWSTSVGLFRSIAEHFGPVGGPALVYTLSAVCLWIAQGRPSLKDLPPRYLVVGGLLFVAYEMCLALAIGFAHNRSQSLELGMINYLWPSLTVLFALWLNNQRSTWLIWPGLLLAIAGVAQVMKGNGDWSPVMMWRNILDNPLAYALAFAAAITWALYCNLTRRWGNGKSGVTLFFCATALALWFHYAFSSDAAFTFTLPGTLQLGFMGLSTAVAYSAWNHGISHGNMTLLATASYFTPVSSALLASLWLGLTPGISFWQGVAMVVAGSLLCWLATRR